MVLSCQRSKSGIVGEYYSEEYNSLERGYFYFSKIRSVAGSSLLINEDSSFVNNNCGNVIKGYWKIDGDFLLLYCTSNLYLTDSLNKAMRPLKCGSVPSKYKVESDRLKSEFYLDGHKMYDNLIKKKD